VFHIAPEPHPAYRSIVRYNRMRYHLMPYIYSLGAMVHFDDYTIMRALVMDFNADPKVRDIGDQFMFGPGLMVCPVYRYQAREREVHFPAPNGWYDIYSGKFLEGGQTRLVAAPYEQVPVYAKSGSIIPVGPEITYVGEKPDAPLTIFVYAGENGSFTLYEDEGVNYNYEQGAFSKITFTYNDEAGTLVIGEREGNYQGMTGERQFNIVLVTPEQPSALSYDAKAQQTVTYIGNEKTINF
jgi:alpha-D-xyloside xylohydrolase